MDDMMPVHGTGIEHGCTHADVMALCRDSPLVAHFPEVI